MFFAILSSYIVYGAITIFLLIYLLLPKRPPGAPPGPAVRIPVIGNLLELSSEDTRTPYRRLRRKYGNIYSLCVGTKFVVVVSGYENLKEALDRFYERPWLFFTEKLTRGLGLSGAVGEIWREHRRFALKTLRNFGFGKTSLEYLIHNEVRELLDYIHDQKGQPFQIKHAAVRSVSSIIGTLACGSKFRSGDAKFDTMLQKLNENSSLASFSAGLTFLPFLQYLPGDLFKVKLLLSNTKQIEDCVTGIVEEHIRDYDENRIEDFTGAFIKEMKARGGDRGQQTTFTVAQLVMVVFDLFVAGTETTSSSIGWSLVYMLNNPKCQERILAEIDEHIGQNRLPSLQDRQHLVYTEAFIMEVLRHANLVILSLPHSTSEDSNFRGYYIPKDTIIIPDLDSVLMDPNVWDKPEEFRPERFISEEGTLKRREEWIPFSTGRRSCLGESLAMMELFLFITSLVQTFQFTVPYGEDVSLPKLDGLFGIIHQAKPFKVKAIPRY